MVDQRISRKLTVIVHADVAGSTALVHLDEALAHERIKQAFHRFSTIVRDYGGVVHETRGDALVTEFSRASDAVCSSLYFQQSNVDHNAQLTDDLVPTIRIGISLGEVIIDDDTLTGPGVVLAQRVEQLAEPNGLCITGAIHEAVPQRLPIDYTDLGKQEVKGFDESVQVYRVSLKPDESVPAPEPVSIESHKSPGEASNKRWFNTVAIIVLLTMVGVAVWTQPWQPQVDPSSTERKMAPVDDRPSIAVLPFANMSGDPDQEYFADGVTEDLTTDLSKVAGLFVIARNSAFTYKGKAVDVKQVAAELGVRYILEGSVRRAGNQLRINAQLIDATTGGHTWAQRYDGNLDDVFGLQDQVTSNIVTVLAVQLSKSAQDRTVTQETVNSDAYDAFLKGWSEYLKQTPDSYVQAIAHFERASKIDSSYSRAYAALAATYWQSWKRFWHAEVGERRWHDARVQAEQFLSKAMQNPTPLAHQLASAMKLQRGQLQDATAQAGRSIAMDPNDPEGYIALAGALSHGGDPQQGALMVEKAMRLNPHYPQYYLYELGLAQFGMGLLDQAATTFEKAIALNSEDVWSQRMLLATYGQLGRNDDAARIRENLSDMDFLELLTVKSALFWHPFKEPQDRERFAEGLRRAGVPD